MNGHERIGQPRVDAASPATTPSIDPLRYCVMTTVALLAWGVGAWAVVPLAGIGFYAYWQATRGGLTRTRCVLKYPALVLAYLGLACIGSAVFLARAYMP